MQGRDVPSSTRLIPDSVHLQKHPVVGGKSPTTIPPKLNVEIATFLDGGETAGDTPAVVDITNGIPIKVDDSDPIESPQNPSDNTTESHTTELVKNNASRMVEFRSSIIEELGVLVKRGVFAEINRSSIPGQR